MPSQTPTWTPTLFLTGTPSATSTTSATNTLTPTPSPSAIPATSTSTQVACIPGSINITALKDAWIDRTNPENNLGGDSNLHVRPTGNSDHQILIKFDLDAIPESCNITAGTLKIHQKDKKDQTIDVYRITQSWGEMSVTWNNAPMANSTVWANFSGNVNVPITRSIDITSLVQGWYEDNFPNHGLLLKSSSGSGDIQFSSRESGNIPTLEVEYGP
jgi:hypothetical protein